MPKSAAKPFPEEHDGFVEIDSVRLKLSHPNESQGQWIGQVL